MNRFESVTKPVMWFMALLLAALLTGCGGGDGAILGSGGAASSANNITAFGFAGFPANPGVVNEPAKTITVTLPSGTNLATLTNATYTTVAPTVKVGAVTQTNGVGPQVGFAAMVPYIVTAADGVTTATYNVTVLTLPSNVATITAFGFAGFPANPGVVNEPAKTITVTLPSGTNLATLTNAVYTTVAPTVKVGAVTQTSGAGPKIDFSAMVPYIVTAADTTTTATYNVTVLTLPSNVATITAFGFAGFSANPGVINEAAKTITVTLPSGTNLATLTNATYATVAPTVKVGVLTQTSNVGPQSNFSAMVPYIVTAADGVTTATYNVTVLTLPSNVATITAFGFAGFSANPGVINEPAKTITVTLPSGTNLATLTNAVYATVAPTVKVGAVTQTSGAGPQINFSAMVPYIVTAADGVATATYNVTVLTLPSNVATITAFGFAGFSANPGVVNEAAKTITVTLPSGTNLATLTNAVYTTVAPTVKVGAVTQTSGAGPKVDFSAMVPYIVTAADGIATATYNVTAILGAPVTVLPGIAGTPGAAATNPTVIASSPSNGDTNVPLQTQNNLAPYVVHVKWVTATFNEAMDPTTITPVGVFTLRDNTLGIDVPGTVTMNAANTIATFKPTAVTLNAGTSYTATITTAAKNAGSITAMPNPVAWSFTTMAASFANQAAPFISQEPVDLLSTANFVILAKTAITDVPTSIITGDIGVSPAAATTIGVSCPEVTGVIYAVDATGPACFTNDATRMTAAISDRLTAYNEAAARPIPDATELFAGDLSGRTIYPGLYKWSSSVLINAGDVVLDAQGDTNAVWIFQIAGNLTLAPGGTVPAGIKVNLIGGAKAANVFWQVGGGVGATLDTYSTFNGNILSFMQVIANTGAVVNGRLFADSQVTLQQNTITKPAP